MWHATPTSLARARKRAGDEAYVAILVAAWDGYVGGRCVGAVDGGVEDSVVVVMVMVMVWKRSRGEVR